MLLLVDKNEEVNPKIIRALQKNFSQVIITNLPHRNHGGVTVTAGDINIPLNDGNILAIERKTPDNFLGSIANRHIFNQVEVMAEHAKYSVIIVTGSFTYGKVDDIAYIIKGENKEKTNWPGASVRGAISVIQYSGCPIIFCPEERYCSMIAEQYNTVNKSDVHQSVVKRRIITFPPIDERIEFLAQMPGIGIKLADSLLTFAGKMDNNADEMGYGSIASALHWLSILVQIDKKERPAGWGPNKILTARKFFGLDSNQYIALPKEVTIGTGKETSSLTELDGHYYEKVPF
jgi:ERCC4-type nuclease